MVADDGVLDHCPHEILWRQVLELCLALGDGVGGVELGHELPHGLVRLPLQFHECGDLVHGRRDLIISNEFLQEVSDLLETLLPFVLHVVQDLPLQVSVLPLIWKTQHQQGSLVLLRDGSDL